MLGDRFEDKVAFVSGGASGIGLAVARAFAERGAKVAIASRAETAGVAARESLVRGGYEAIWVPADVRDEASVERAVAAAVERYGKLDVAVNAAGIAGDMAPLEAASQTVWDDVMATNARGV